MIQEQQSSPQRVREKFTLRPNKIICVSGSRLIVVYYLKEYLKEKGLQTQYGLTK
jgi:hypothetical protein